MFDPTPANLPVEPKPSSPPPAPKPPASPSVPPAAPPVAPRPTPPPGRPLSPPTPTPPPASSFKMPTPPPPPPSTGKKEPEDILAGLDKPGPMMKPEPSMMTTPTRRSSPLKTIGLIVGILVMLGAVSYAVWVFVLKPSSAPAPAPVAPKAPEQVEQPPATQNETPPVTAPPAGSNIPVPEPIQPTPPPTAVEATSAAAVPPPTPPAEGKDSDSDSLTDAEEPLYHADVNSADTNGNGYPDGIEVQNLYSPVTARALLASETFMKADSWSGWSYLLPRSWTVAQTAEGTFVVSDSASRFRLQQQPNTDRKPLADWIGPTLAPGMTSFKTKSGLDAMQSADGFTTYIASGDTVMIVTYALNGDRTIEYRTTYKLFINSLHP